MLKNLVLIITICISIIIAKKKKKLNLGNNLKPGLIKIRYFIQPLLLNFGSRANPYGLAMS